MALLARYLARRLHTKATCRLVDHSRIECRWGDKTAVLHKWWLQDNDPAFIDVSSGQKLRSSGEIDLSATLRNASTNEKELRIVWANGSESVFDLDWLREYAPPAPTLQTSAERPKLWTAENLQQHLPQVQYKDVLSDDQALWQLLQQLHEYGVSFVRNVPVTDIDESAKLIQRFGYIRETFYGRLWDVKSVPQAINIAYTAGELKHHMDLEYFEAPPGLQLLHCLVASAKGGESTFLDSFKAAELLQQESPGHYETLKRIPVTFHYRRNQHHLRFHKATIECDGLNEYTRINYAPPFQGPLNVSPDDIEAFYPAFKAFEEIIQRPDLTYETRLNPGDLVIFNNRRVFHGRKEFDAHGLRHLRGSYMDLDDFRNVWRVLGERYRK